jgi:hypothetical protein
MHELAGHNQGIDPFFAADCRLAKLGLRGLRNPRNRPETIEQACRQPLGRIMER